MYYIVMMKRLLKVSIISIITIFTIYLFLAVTANVFHMGKEYTPNNKIDISSILNKDELGDSDYETLFTQTGLTRIGIDRMKDTQKHRILEIQDDYFKDVEVNRREFGHIVCSCDTERVINHTILEKGDILISLSTHISFIHFGHAELYIGDSKTISLSSYALESNYDIENNFFNRGNFLVLRVKDIDNIDEIIENAKSIISDVKYRISTGILTRKNPPKLKYSQCAHIIWYIFNKYGTDLDSNKGLVVTPNDILKSKKLELIQIYGLDYNKLFN